MTWGFQYEVDGVIKPGTMDSHILLVTRAQSRIIETSISRHVQVVQEDWIGDLLDRYISNLLRREE